MSKYTSKTVTVDKPAADVSARFDDLSKLQAFIDQLPAEQRQQIGDIAFTPDSITINTSQVGSVTFKVTEHTPTLVKFEAVGSPVPVSMDVNIQEATADTAHISTAIEAQIPMMLRPMVAPHLQKAVDMLADFMGRVCG